MKINLDLTEADIKVAIADYVLKHTGLEPDDYVMEIETRSKQNYKSEWEAAEFRIKFTITK
jgi:hypothetical protein